jgi:hypothetical protein
MLPWAAGTASRRRSSRRCSSDYAKSPLFTDAEKIALEYADAITDTRRDVDDELFAHLQTRITTTTPSRR